MLGRMRGACRGKYFGPGTKVCAFAYGWPRALELADDLNADGGRGPYANAAAQPCAGLSADAGRWIN